MGYAGSRWVVRGVKEIRGAVGRVEQAAAGPRLNHALALPARDEIKGSLVAHGKDKREKRWAAADSAR
jgi:hypothetical protein